MKKQPRPPIASILIQVTPTKRESRALLQTLAVQKIIDSVGTAFIVMLQSRDFKIAVQGARKRAKGKK